MDVSLDYLILGRKNTGTALKKDLLDLAGKLRCMVEEL